MSDHWTAPDPADPQGQPERPVDETSVLTPGAATSSHEVLGDGPSAYGPVTDILGSEPASKASRKKLVGAVAAGAVVVAGIGAGAAYAAGAFGGGGSQPDTFVPATAVGYASVDLDPSLGQKVQALRFLRKFPSAKASLGSTDDIRQWAFDQITKDDPDTSSIDYATDVKPWLGDRFAVAVLPPRAAGQEPSPIVVLQVTDAGKAKTGLAKLSKGSDDAACAVNNGYAVCAQSQADLDAAKAATAKGSLADDSSFKQDVDAAGGRGIATVWGDLDKIRSLVPADQLAQLGGPGALSAFGSLGTTGDKAGRIVAVARFTGGNLEVTGKTVGGPASTFKPGHGTGVDQLPSGTQAAMGIAVAPGALDQGWASELKQFKAQGLGPEVNRGLQELELRGFQLPKDLDSLFGSRFAVAYGGTGADGLPEVGVRAAADPAKAGDVIDRVNDLIGGFGVPFAVHHVPAPGGYAAALTEPYAKTLATQGGLGGTAAFKAAVPDAAGATFVMYADLASLSTSVPELGGDDDLKPLKSFGFSATADSASSASFRLELITR